MSIEEPEFHGWLYHEDAPDGEIHRCPASQLAELKEQGWQDYPIGGEAPVESPETAAARSEADEVRQALEAQAQSTAALQERYDALEGELAQRDTALNDATAELERLRTENAELRELLDETEGE